MKLIERAASWGMRALSRFAPDEQESEVVRPDLGRFYSGIRDDYSVDGSLRSSLTPAKMGSAMRAADEGDTASQYEVFEIVEQDGHITSVMTKRRKAVTGRELQILPAIEDEGTAEGKRALQAAELCQELLWGKWGHDGVSNWHDALFDLTDAIGKGFAVGQIVWGTDGGVWRPERIERWPQGECRLGTMDTSVQFLQNADEIRIITDTERVEGVPLGLWQWVTHMQKAWSVPLARAALFRAITWHYLFKRFSWRDWAIFAERYGMPLRVGRYHPGADDAERAALWKAVSQLGKDAACIMPEQSNIELLESKATSSGGGGMLPYPVLIDHCDREISKAVMGSTMTADPGDRGARSQGEVYERAEDDLTRDDCRRLAETLRRDLVTPLVGFNLGWDWPIPKVQFHFEEADDLGAEVQVDKVLVKDLGLPLGKRYFYERYDRPEPEDGEELVSAPEPQPPPGQPQPDEDDDGDQGDEDRRLNSRPFVGAAALADEAGDAAEIEGRASDVLVAHADALLEAVASGAESAPPVDGLAEVLEVADLWGRLWAKEQMPLARLSGLNLAGLRTRVKKAKLATAKQIKKLARDYERKAKSLASDVWDRAKEAAGGLSVASDIKDALRKAGLTRDNAYHFSTVAVNSVWSSINHGRWRTQRRRPALWKYVTAGDDRVRATHRLMDGKIWPSDDPVWDSWYPPNGHHCRCVVQVVTDGRIQNGPPTVKPDKGWEQGPGSWLQEE